MKSKTVYKSTTYEGGGPLLCSALGGGVGGVPLYLRNRGIIGATKGYRGPMGRLSHLWRTTEWLGGPAGLLSGMQLGEIKMEFTVCIKYRPFSGLTKLFASLYV